MSLKNPQTNHIESRVVVVVEFRQYPDSRRSEGKPLPPAPFPREVSAHHARQGRATFYGRAGYIHPLKLLVLDVRKERDTKDGHVRFSVIFDEHSCLQANSTNSHHTSYSLSAFWPPRYQYRGSGVDGLAAAALLEEAVLPA